MILGIADDHDAASASFDLLTLRDAFGGVVGALGVKVRMNFADQGADIGFRKDYNRIDICESGQDLRTFFSGDYGTAFAFQRARRGIRVDRDDDFAAEFARRMQIAHMAHVQHIETTVGQRDAVGSAAPFRDPLLEFTPRENLPMD